MHLQVRASTLSGSGGSVGAERRLDDVVQADPINVRPGALVAMLDVLRAAGVNLRVAGGHGIETTGEFVFAVHSRDGEGEEEKATIHARDALRDAGYAADIFEVRYAELDDQVGALEKFLSTLGDELVHEIFVGTPNDRGQVLVQVTTLKVASSVEAAPKRSAAARV